MEHTIAAPHDGVVADIATEGAQITEGTVLVTFEEAVAITTAKNKSRAGSLSGRGFVSVAAGHPHAPASPFALSSQRGLARVFSISGPAVFAA